MQPADPDRLMTTEEAAALLRISPATLTRLGSDGPRAIRIGRRRLYRRETVLAWAEAQAKRGG